VSANVIDPTVARVLAARADSDFLRAVASVRRDGGLALALERPRLRQLYPEEIVRLEGQGNTADDWSRVRVGDGFDWRRVLHSSFHGDVVLGRFARRVGVAPGLELPAGVYRSTLSNCVVGDDALVRDVKLLVNYVVGPGAVLVNCGRITCDRSTAFGNGAALPLGIESGGRDVAIYAEIDVDMAATVARARARHEFLQAYARAVADYAAEATCERGIIERDSAVSNTPTIHNTYLGPCAFLDGATFITDSTLLSSENEPVRVESGACVSHSLLQWGSSAATLALVERSVLTEHAHVEQHGKVTASVLGPNTAVAGGEVTACLLGPFVGFHHQALLIASLWPEGKGNVGYGANVGSNHTGKAPDQEFWPGEGLFLGLGVNIKFPSDFTQAPYTIVACGTNTLPQKLTFPFSLLSPPSVRASQVPPAYNEIAPGWVLAHNLYTLRRNESKYRARNQARRARLTFDVFRPDTIDLMRDACRRLETVAAPKEFYTDRDIKGLGNNYLQEAARRSAITAYRFHIRHYALLGLLEAARTSGRERLSALSRLLAIPGDNPRWEHQRQLLLGELGISDVLTGLRLLPDLLESAARDVERSKARDDERGPGIIPDYADAHAPAAEDPFVRQTWEETRQLQAEVANLIDLLARQRAARSVILSLPTVAPLQPAV
jgi:hypothetical protein